MDNLRKKIEHALSAIYGHPGTESLAADFVMQVLREQEPIAKIHDDGYWTHAPGKDPLDQYSGKSQMEVFASPMPASVPEELADAIRENVRCFRHAETGLVRYALPSPQCDDPKWRDAMIIQNLSNETIDWVLAAAPKPGEGK